jgi:predicted  nucleic acid-binding Zn-ribbon protein
MPIYDLPTLVEDKINEAVAHLVAELDGMAQRCEELEIELECMKNAFPEHEDEILPKHRGIFDNDN